MDKVSLALHVNPRHTINTQLRLHIGTIYGERWTKLENTERRSAELIFVTIIPEMKQ